MKTKAVIYLVIFILLGCSVETENIVREQENKTLYNKISTQSSLANPDPLDYSQTELVIKFNPGIDAEAKESIRQSHDVIKYETCSCSNEDIEVWHFNTDENIKSRLGETEADPDLEGSELQYYITNSNNLFNINGSNLKNLQTKVAASNRDVVIAVIDSGVDYNYEGFNIPFLYDTSQESSCSDDPSKQNISGWDFVNDDNDVYDDNGHGTIVTYSIFEKLRDARVPFRILPIKAFNEEGKTKYSTIVCSYIYAINNPDVDIINMSFGWYYKKLAILNSYIATTNNILLSTSAGNKSIDTDAIPHYPSGYEYDFILTTTGIKSTYDALAPMANFGDETVDIAAANEFIFMYDNTSHLHQGTSFSAAETTARAATLYTNGVNPMILKNDVIYSGVYLSSLNNIKYPYTLD